MTSEYQIGKDIVSLQYQINIASQRIDTIEKVLEQILTPKENDAKQNKKSNTVRE